VQQAPWLFPTRILLLLVLSVLLLHQRPALAASAAQDELVSLEFRYRLPEAGEVVFIWGIDDWKPVPEAQRPTGTVVEDQVMRTPMLRVDDTFVVSVRVPAGVPLDYGFQIRSMRDGTPISPLFDGDYRLFPFQDDVLEMPALVQLPLVVASTHAPGAAPATALVTRTFRYRLPEAGDVLLVWGLDGWQLVDEAQRPAGTFVEAGVMHTAMVREGDSFVITLEAPAGTPLDYGFQIRSAHAGSKLGVLWDGDYQLVSDKHETIVLDAAVSLADQSTLRVADEAPLVIQELSYRSSEAGAVWLSWGVNGWQKLPEAQRPADTRVEENVMRTPMTREGDLFVARVPVPKNARLDYGFLVTRTRSGAQVRVWDGGGADGYALTVAEAGKLETQARPQIVRHSGNAGFDHALQLRALLVLLVTVLLLLGASLLYFRRVAQRASALNNDELVGG